MFVCFRSHWFTTLLLNKRLHFSEAELNLSLCLAASAGLSPWKNSEKSWKHLDRGCCKKLIHKKSYIYCRHRGNFLVIFRRSRAQTIKLCGECLLFFYLFTLSYPCPRVLYLNLGPADGAGALDNIKPQNQTQRPGTGRGNAERRRCPGKVLDLLFVSAFLILAWSSETEDRNISVHVKQ